MRLQILAAVPAATSPCLLCSSQRTLKPFRWDEQGGRFVDTPHLGQPQVFDFDFELLKPWT